MHSPHGGGAEYSCESVSRAFLQARNPCATVSVGAAGAFQRLLDFANAGPHSHTYWPSCLLRTWCRSVRLLRLHLAYDFEHPFTLGVKTSGQEQVENCGAEYE